MNLLIIGIVYRYSSSNEVKPTYSHRLLDLKTVSMYEKLFETPVSVDSEKKELFRSIVIGIQSFETTYESLSAILCFTDDTNGYSHLSHFDLGF